MSFTAGAESEICLEQQHHTTTIGAFVPFPPFNRRYVVDIHSAVRSDNFAYSLLRYRLDLRGIASGTCSIFFMGSLILIPPRYLVPLLYYDYETPRYPFLSFFSRLYNFHADI